MKIMDALYRGKIYPAEQVMSGNAEYRKASGKLADGMDALKERFSEDDYSAVEELMDLMIDICSIETEENFKYGLALGLHLMREAGEVPGLEGFFEDGEEQV